MWPTIIISVIIVALVIFIVANEIIKKKKGKGGCSCGCGGCAMKDVCHSKTEE
jgi:hypothetical protein